MQSQEKMCFGRTMIPCDYDAELAKDEKGCVVIKAYAGKKQAKEK